MTANAGDLVAGRYRLVEQVGRGGMGRVWRGRDEELRQDVAVKEIVLPQGVSDDEQDTLIRRVRREAMIAANLRHPAIVRVHGIVEHDGAPMIVMEYVAGRSLRGALDAQGPLSVPRAARVGAAVLDALTHAHAAGVVHRDVKPDNILLSEQRSGQRSGQRAEQRAALTDFGIARLVEGGGTTLTVTGSLIGTPQYMSPEQLEGKEITPASDLWSLGATLYTAVEGRPPFTGESLTNLYVAILLQPPAAPVRAGALAPLLLALLTKDPAARPDTAAVARALDDLGREGTLELPAGGVAVQDATPTSALPPPLPTIPLDALHTPPRSPGATLKQTAPAASEPPSASEPPATPEPPGTRGRPVRGRRAFLAAGFGLLAAGGVGAGVAAALDHSGSSGKAGAGPSPTVTTATLTLRKTLFGRDAKGVFAAAFSPDGTALAATPQVGSVRIWRAADLRRRTDFATSRNSSQPGTQTVYSVAFSPDGRTLASGNGDGSVELWDMGTGLRREGIDVKTNNGQWIGFLTVVAFSPDGKLLATSYNDQKVSLWDVATRTRLAVLDSRSDWWTASLAFSPDGRFLAVGQGDGLSNATAADGGLHLWHVADRTKAATLAVTNCNLNSLAFSPDRRTLAVATGEGTLRRWNLHSLTATATDLTNQASNATSVAYSHDGTLLASGNRDGTISLWSAGAGRLLALAQTGPPLGSNPFGSPATSVAFSPDRKSLASGGNSLTVWSIQSVGTA